MGSRTVWFLLLFVLLLGGIALWQLEREKSGQFETDRPLFEGVLPERLRAVRIDNLERGLQLTMERDANGTWQIVDPLAYPAEGGVLDRLLEIVAHNRAIPAEAANLKGFSLDPPRVVLELVETLPEGERTLRLELGAKDIDGKHVFARVDGRVVRTSLNLDSTLERDLGDWRQRRILNAAPATVLEVRRTGLVALDEQEGLTDLAFEAGTTETGWRSTRPWNAALDPAAVGPFLSTVCYMQARTFLADSAAEAAAYGLSQPDLRVELSLQGGSEIALLMKRHRESQSWICMREGSSHVFRVDDSSALLAVLPSDGFLDAQLVRFVRDEVQRIELHSGERSVSLRREGTQWKLGARDGALTQVEMRADSEAVLDLIGALENARVAKHLVYENAQPFAAGDSVESLSIVTGEGEFKLEFGAAQAASPGVPGRLFRRAGEDVVGIVESAVAELASRPWAELADRQLVSLPELGIASIELTRGGQTRKFERDPVSGRWSPAGADAQAPKAFIKCVDRLLSLRADVSVGPAGAFVLLEPWEVLVVDIAGFRTTYRLGDLTLDPAQQGFDDGRLRGIVTSSGLVSDLALIP